MVAFLRGDRGRISAVSLQVDGALLGRTFQAR
jgi:hypothetical protein